MFSAIVQASLHKDISESQKILDSYNEEISELKEKLLHVDAGERNFIRTRIENLEQARDELMNILEEKKSMAENGGIMSFQDYLATAAGTEFEKDPEKAMAEFAKGVEMGPKVTAKECMQPIRSKAAMPDSEVRFYSPEMGVTVTRKFEVENDVVYSIYSFKTEKGELYEFSDKGMTKAEWNTQTLPQMLDKAGISYELIPYEVDPENLAATHVAEQLGEDIERVFKTLVLRGDRNGIFVCVVPGDMEVDLKAAAKISGNKSAEMIAMKELLPTTGYIRGGCSPIGMKKHFPTYIHATAVDFDFIYVSAGVRGIQAKIAPQSLISFIGATVGEIAAH